MKMKTIKKHRWLIALLVLICAALLVWAGVTLLSGSKIAESDLIDQGLNGAYHNKDRDGWIYTAGTTLQKRSADGTQSVTLVQDRCDQVYVINDWVIYRTAPISTNQGEPTFYRIKTDGSKRAAIGALGRDEFVIDGAWIYYVRDKIGISNKKENGLYRANIITGKSDALLYGEVSSPALSDGWLYMNSDNYLYKIKPDGSELTRLVGEDENFGYENITVDDGWIYFEHRFYSTVGAGIFRIKTNGSEKEHLNEDPRIYTIRVADGWIYYTSGDPYEASGGLTPAALDPPKIQVLRMKPDGSERTELSERYIKGWGLIVEGEWITLQQKNGSLQIKTDGSESVILLNSSD